MVCKETAERNSAMPTFKNAMNEDLSESRQWLTFALLLLVIAAPVALAQIPGAGAAAPPEPAVETQWESILQAARRIPLAAALGAILAFRPRRRGTPPRSANGAGRINPHLHRRADA